VPLIQERLTKFDQAASSCDFFFTDELTYDANLLPGKKLSREDAMRGLEAATEQLQAAPFETNSLEEKLRALAAELGLKTGEFFGLLRVATTGRTAAPPLFQTMAVLGKERCLKRIQAAIKKLKDKV
jgi:glutamyl-tRNA synthetase